MSSPAHWHIELLDQRQAGVAHAVHGVLQQAYAQEAALLQAHQFAPLSRTVADLQASPEFFLGAWQGEHLVGALSVGPDDEPGQICISMLVVHPAHQRQGVARALVHDAVLRAGGAAVTVATAAANTPALALYHAMGFVVYRHGQMGGCGQDPLPIVKLRRAPPAPCPTEPPAARP